MWHLFPHRQSENTGPRLLDLFFDAAPPPLEYLVLFCEHLQKRHLTPSESPEPKKTLGWFSRQWPHMRILRYYLLRYLKTGDTFSVYLAFQVWYHPCGTSAYTARSVTDTPFCSSSHDTCAIPTKNKYERTSIARYEKYSCWPSSEIIQEPLPLKPRILVKKSVKVHPSLVWALKMTFWYPFVLVSGRKASCHVGAPCSPNPPIRVQPKAPEEFQHKEF